MRMYWIHKRYKFQSNTTTLLHNYI